MPHFSGEWVGCPGHAQAMPRPCPDHAQTMRVGGVSLWRCQRLLLLNTMEIYGNLWITSSCQLHQLEGQDETAGYVKKIPRSMPGRYDYSEVEKDLYRCGFSVLQCYAAICRNAHDAAGSAVCDNASLQKSRKCIQVPRRSATCIWFKINVARSGSLNGLLRLVGRCRFFST